MLCSIIRKRVSIHFVLVFDVFEYDGGFDLKIRASACQYHLLMDIESNSSIFEMVSNEHFFPFFYFSAPHFLIRLLHRTSSYAFLFFLLRRTQSHLEGHWFLFIRSIEPNIEFNFGIFPIFFTIFTLHLTILETDYMYSKEKRSFHSKSVAHHSHIHRKIVNVKCKFNWTSLKPSASV